MIEIAILVPTYNERDNIVELLIRVVRACQGTHFIAMVIDDSSPDGTAQVVEQAFQYDDRVQIITRDTKEGLGAAYLDGFRKAITLKPRLIATLDADLSHSPELLPTLIRSAREFDLVIGSRYVTGAKVLGLSRYRRFLSSIANLAWRLLTRTQILDLTSAFRVYEASSLEKVLETKEFAKDYAFLSEIAIRYLQNGFRVKEIPIDFLPRKSGSSKLSIRALVESAFTLLKLKLDAGSSIREKRKQA